MRYSEYIKIEELHNLQCLVSQANEKDELTFIIVHQISELLMRIVHSELDAFIQLGKHNPKNIVNSLAKIVCAFEQLNGQLKLCSFVSPEGFAAIRSTVYPATAEESEQFSLFFNRVSGPLIGEHKILSTVLQGTIDVAKAAQKKDLINSIGHLRRLVNEWKEQHIALAENFLGTGTGATSSGADYLRKKAKSDVFPALHL
ncbi:MAG: tryptophan 2,3-dioxygenase family protein [Candidatus Thiodiazotropha sp.]